MSRFTKEHYEDVAKVLKAYLSQPTKGRVYHLDRPAICEDFADLFAADNPQRCTHCGTDQPSNAICSDGSGILPHHLIGFDRERFLAACGLKPERAEPQSLGFHQ